MLVVPVKASPVDRHAPYREFALPTYRGSIRHVQSDDMVQFSRWEKEVAFTQRCEPL